MTSFGTTLFRMITRKCDSDFQTLGCARGSKKYKDYKWGELNIYLDIHRERTRTGTWDNWPRPSEKYLETDRAEWGEQYPKVSSRPHWKSNYISPDVLDQYEEAIKRGGPKKKGFSWDEPPYYPHEAPGGVGGPGGISKS